MAMSPAATAVRRMTSGRPPADLRRAPCDHMDLHMKQILIDLDDRCARDLERVAPTKKRMRAEFVRLAIRHAIDVALDRATAEAYRARPSAGKGRPDDLVGWDPQNDLAQPARSPRKARGRKSGAKSAA